MLLWLSREVSPQRWGTCTSFHEMRVHDISKRYTMMVCRTDRSLHSDSHFIGLIRLLFHALCNDRPPGCLGWPAPRHRRPQFSTAPYMLHTPPQTSRVLWNAVVRIRNVLDTASKTKFTSVVLLLFLWSFPAVVIGYSANTPVFSSAICKIQNLLVIQSIEPGTYSVVTGHAHTDNYFNAQSKFLSYEG